MVKFEKKGPIAIITIDRPEAKNAVITAVSAAAATDSLLRARTAFYLVATSSQYQVER